MLYESYALTLDEQAASTLKVTLAETFPYRYAGESLLRAGGMKPSLTRTATQVADTTARIAEAFGVVWERSLLTSKDDDGQTPTNYEPQSDRDNPNAKPNIYRALTCCIQWL